nr:hypothetical protein [Tanacetum cinerariifolium]
MSSTRELTFFLGLLVKQKEDAIFISQDKYVAKILQKFGLTEGKSASTPIDTETPLLKDPDGEDVDVHIYRSMIGSLMYLTSSRPDIVFAICACLLYTSAMDSEPNAGLWFWNTVAVKQSNDVTRLQALVDKKKVVVTEAAIRDALHLDDAKGVDCLPNEETFTALARMGYEKQSTKPTFYKAFFSSQWKFLIHTILQSMSAKRTSWNEFSSAIASAVICLATGHKFNFSKYIFDSLVRNVDSSSKFYMYPRRVGKGCLGVETPLFEGMLVVREPEEQGDTEEQGNDDNATEEPVTAVSENDEALDAYAALARRVKHLEHDKVAQDLEIIKLKTRVKKLERSNKVKTLKLRRLKKVGTSQRVDTFNDTLMEDVSNQGRIIDELDKDKGVVLMSEKEENETEEEAVEVVTTAKLITKVVAAFSETVSAAAVTETVSTAAVVPTITDAPVKVDVPSTRQRRGVVIRDQKEESFAKTPTKTNSMDKGKGIMVEKPKPMKKKQQVELDEAYARKLHEELNQDIDWEVAMDHVKQKSKENSYVQRYQTMKKRPQREAQARRNMMMYLKNTAGFRMDYFKGMSYEDIRPIFEAKFNSNIEFLLKTKEQIEEEENRAIASINETSAQKAAKSRRLNEEAKDVKELKQHLEIVPDEDDDVYTEATPLARKVPVVDYQIVHFNNKPHYKIIRADETHQLYVSFITLLKNFDREELESLWSIVKERFSTSKPNNFLDDFMLTTLKAMFRRPDGQDQVWMSQRGVHGQAKVKSWKLLESCGVHIVALTTTQLIMLVERRYPLLSLKKLMMVECLEWEVVKACVLCENMYWSLSLNPKMRSIEEEEVFLVDGVFEGAFGTLALEMEALVDAMEVYCWVIIYINHLNLSTVSFRVDAAMELKEKHEVFTAASEELSTARHKLMLLDSAAG